MNRKIRETTQAFKTAGASPQLLAEEIERLRSTTDDFSDAVYDAGDASADVFGDSILKNVGSLGLKISGLLAPLAAVKLGLANLDADIAAAGAQDDAAIESTGGLKQQARSQAELDRFLDQGEQLFLAGATSSKDAAQKAVFDLAGAGSLDDGSFKLLKNLASQAILPDLGKFSAAVATQRATFGVEEIGTPGQIIAKSFAAANVGTSSVEVQLSAAAKSAASANQAGLSDEFNAAAVAAIGLSATPEEGATQFDALLFSLSDVAKKNSDERTKRAGERTQLEEKIKGFDESIVSAEARVSSAELRDSRGIEDAEERVSDAEEDLLSLKPDRDKKFANRRLEAARLALQRRLEDGSSVDTSRVDKLKKQRDVAKLELSQPDEFLLPANFADQSITDQVLTLSDLNLESAELKELLGRKEAVRGLDTFARSLKNDSNEGFFQILKSIKDAERDPTAAIQGRLDLVAPLQEAALAKRRDENRKVVRYEDEAAIDKFSEIAQERGAQAIRDGLTQRLGDNFASRLIGAGLEGFDRVLDNSIQTFLGPETFLEGGTTPPRDQLDASEQKALDRLIENKKEVVEGLGKDKLLEESKNQTRGIEKLTGVLEEVRDKPGVGFIGVAQ